MWSMQFQMYKCRMFIATDFVKLVIFVQIDISVTHVDVIIIKGQCVPMTRV